jgi:hypothetical protein
MQQTTTPQTSDVSANDVEFDVMLKTPDRLPSFLAEGWSGPPRD